MTKTKVYILIVLALSLFAVPIAATVRAESVLSPEYQIKAAFLFNFIKFVDWPEDKWAQDNETVTIGIIGEDPFDAIFEPLKSKQVKGKRVIVKHFAGFKELKKTGRKDKAGLRRQIEALRKCHVLFICSSEKDSLAEIIEALHGFHVLTVSETADFLETGGIINFLMKDKKVAFEINITAARQADLTIRSRFLRLAERVVEEKPLGVAKD